MLVLAGFILLCLSAGAVGGLFTVSSIPTWYAGLVKPSFNPPNWIFAPVWNTLYLMMAVSVWLVWRKLGWRQGRGLLLVFFGQLVLNVLWSVLFFGLRRPDLALIEIIVLWSAIAWTIVVFWRVSKVASIMLWPYLAWVSFATVLNAALWSLNR